MTAYDLHQHHKDSSGQRRSAFNIPEGCMLKKLISVMHEQLWHSVCVWKEKHDGTLNWTSLMDPDKLKLLKHLPRKFNICQPIDMVSDVQAL